MPRPPTPSSRESCARSASTRSSTSRCPPTWSSRDETGRQVKLGDYFGKNPVILNLVYFECPMLCSQVTNGLVQSMRLLSLSAGKDFTVLTVSFDPRETAGLSMAKRAGYLEGLRQGGRRGRLALPDGRRGEHPQR